MRRHLGSVHGRRDLLYDSQKKDFATKTPSLPPEVKKELDEKLINAIIIDSRPFGDFSRPGMKMFLTAAIPQYKPLHRTTISRRLAVLYKEHRQSLKKVLSNIPHVSLTTDIWRSNRSRYFISLTGHFFDADFKLICITLGFRLIRGRHISKRLKKFIEFEIKFYGIGDKIRSCTTDNALNITNAITSLNIGTNYSCMAHNLNLMVKSTILPSRKL